MTNIKQLSAPTHQVDVGDRARMTIINPLSFADGGLEWQLRYGDPIRVRYIAAEAIASYDYLLSANINMKEAARRLRLMRKARKNLLVKDTPKCIT